MSTILPEINSYAESDGYEWTDTTSSDSGIASCCETRPPSNASNFSLENDFWSACSTFEDPLYVEHDSMLIQQSLVGMLNSDINTVKTSSMRLLYLCRSGYTESILTACPDILTIIWSVLHNIDVSKDAELMHSLSGIFYYLTETEMSLNIMSTPTGIFVIKQLLSFTLESALCYATAGLHNMLSNRTLREKLRVPPIISQLIHILWTCYLFDKSIEPIVFPNIFIVFASVSSLSKFLAVLFDSLYLIAHRNETAKRLIHIKQGIIPLIHFIRTHSYEKLHWTCARLLRSLSAYPQTKIDILNHDSELSFFSVFVNSSSPKITFIAYWILCNLSDKFMSVSPSNLTGILTSLTMKLHELIDLLSKSMQFNALNGESLEKFTVMRCIAGTLANFTCRNPSVKSYLVQTGLVSILTRLLVSIVQNGPPGLFSCSAYTGHPLESPHFQSQRSQLNPKKYSSSFEDAASTPSELEIPPPLVQDLGDYQRAPPLSIPLVTPNPSLISCRCGQRSLSVPHLQTITELVEAALRCLTHLSSAHSGAANVTYCLLSGPDFLHTLCDASTSWMLEVMQLIPSLKAPPLPDGVENYASLCTCNEHVFPRPNQVTCGFELTNSLQLVKAWLSLARILLTEVIAMEYSIGNSEEPENFFATQVEEVSRSTLTRGRVELYNEQMANVQVLRESVARLGPKLRDILQTIQPSALSRTCQATVQSCQNLLDSIEHL